MFKDNFKNLRMSRNLTQNEVAKLLNVSFKTISHWEQGYTEPSLEMLTKIKNCLDADYNELLD